MKFLVISHAIHKRVHHDVFSYAPYVKEMNLWFKYVDEVTVVAPFSQSNIDTNIEASYQHNKLTYKALPKIQFTNITHVITSLFKTPYILIIIFLECLKTDHIHLRCPGNIGLLGCCIQVLFPRKTKTAKYAGNWDPNSNQPLSYRIQKKLLKNTFFSKNMSVLVYGSWKNQTENIVPFFTASYYSSEIEPLTKRNYKETLQFIFVGTLSPGKRPLFAIQFIETLNFNNIDSKLTIFGEGMEGHSLKTYVKSKGLENIIEFKGNKSKDIIKSAYKKAHFAILPSKSEGWPKALAEAMFFGVIPIATKISCIPYMLDNGNRGFLIKPELQEAVSKFIKCIVDGKKLQNMSQLAHNWSKNYTLDYFEKEIGDFIKR
ncbi:MAG: glycosyltransferase [Jejuia sp.]